MNENEKVDIVLINYNAYQDTVECIESIYNNNYTHINILIVDNCSTNESVSQLEKFLSTKFRKYYKVKYNFKEKKYFLQETINKMNNNIILIQSDVNAGFGSGNNIGFNFSKQYLNSKYCWILNNDVTIEKDTITNLIECEKKNKDSFIGATIIEYYDKKIIGRIARKYILSFFGIN